MRTNEQPKERSHTSLLPLPNPLITLPSSRRGNGASGPLSGPAVGSRGPSGLMIVVVWKYCFSFLIFDPLTGESSSILQRAKRVRKKCRDVRVVTRSRPINVQLTRFSNPNLEIPRCHHLAIAALGITLSKSQSSALQSSRSMLKSTSAIDMHFY